jgi:hypothetical protein
MQIYTSIVEKTVGAILPKWGYGGDEGAEPGTFDALWTRYGVGAETVITLTTIKVVGIITDSVVTPSVGVTLSINSAPFASGATTMSEGDTITARLTSGVYEAEVTGTVVINGTTCNISLTTMAEQVGFESYTDEENYTDTENYV